MPGQTRKQKDWNKNNLEKVKVYKRRYRENNREKLRESGRVWSRENKERRSEYARRRYEDPTNAEKTRVCSWRSVIRDKVLVLEIYGKKCVWCGNDKFEVLCIDHINGGGAAHRKNAIKGGHFYGWLVGQLYQPDIFQVLCHNCNAAKEHFGVEPGVVEYRPFEYWKEISKKRVKGGESQ